MRLNNLTKYASIYTLSNIAIAAIPFFLLPIMTRVLSPADYGTVAMFGIVVSIFAAFTGLETGGALYVRYYEQNNINFAEYISSCLLILIVSFVVILILIFFVREPLSLLLSVPSDWVLIAIFVAAFQTVILTRLTIWQVSNKVWHYASFQIGQSLMNVALSLWLVLVVGLAWRGRTLGLLISTLLLAVFAIYSLWHDDWIRFKISKMYIKDALKFGVPLIPHSLGGLLIASVDRIMVTNMLDLAQTGIYTVAMQIGMVLSILTNSFNKAYAPWLFENLKTCSHVKKIKIVRYTYVYFLIVIAIATVLGLSAPFILSFLVGESFRHGSNIVLYIAIGFALGGMYFMVTNYVIWAGATARLAGITLVSGLINFIVTYIFIDKYGLMGAGYGFVLSQAVSFLGTWYLAHKVCPMPWKRAIFN